MSNKQPEKAWKVFLDLSKRGSMLAEDFPRMVGCFLADKDAQGGQAWTKVDFPENADPTLLTALLIHDGQFERATETLNQLVKNDPENIKLRWYMGLAYSQLQKRDIAVFLTKKSLPASGDLPEVKAN